MCEVNPKNKKHMRVENGVNLLYLQITKALHGCIKDALLWYDIYSKTFKSHGFLVNPYDRCIENSTIKGKQCTIACYVDNNKVSHIDEEVNTKSIESIADHFGNLTISRGKKHKFLGMDTEFLDNGNLCLFMKYCIEESIDFFGEELSVTVSSLAKKGLQKINKG